MFLPFLVVLTALILETTSEPVQVEEYIDTTDTMESVMYIRIQRVPVGPGMFVEVSDTLAVFEGTEDAY